jgi:GTP-binding protein
MRIPEIVIIGRPNAGKSTLFNRLLGRRDAVIHPQAGVTRDRKYTRLQLDEQHTVALVDTGGLFPDTADDFSRDTRQQAELALQNADLVLFLVDVSAISALDHDLASMIRRSNTPVLLLANKIDRLRDNSLPNEMYEFGFPDVIPISANHGVYCEELKGRLLEFFRAMKADPGAVPQEDISFALIGRPNVGKSSLMNALLQRERAIVSPIAGTTRDSIDDYFTFGKYTFRAIDTAGLRRKARVREDIEFYSTLRTERSVEEADVTVLLLEEETLLTEQDKKITGMAEKAGSGIIFSINKWDLAEDTSAKKIRELTDKIRFQLPEFSWVPILTTSAVSKRGLKKLLNMIISVHENVRRSIDTPELNRFVQQELRVQAPAKRGKQLKIYYAVQTGVSPPVFTFFVNNAMLATPQYIQYIRNSLRRCYEYTGVPLYITLRDKRDKKEE